MSDARKKKMTILVLMVAVAVALGAVQYVPIHRQEEELSRTLKAQSLTMDQIREKCGLLPTLHRQVLDLESCAAEYDRRLPPKKQFAQLWQEIAEIMDRNQLTDQLVRPGSEVCEDGLCMIPLQIECRGTLKQMFQFLQELEQFKRLVRIENIQLENDRELSGRLSFHAQAEVYYQAGGEDEG